MAAIINDNIMDIVENMPTPQEEASEFELLLADLTNDIDEDDLLSRNESSQQVNFKPIADTINDSNISIPYTPFSDHDAACPCNTCWPHSNNAMLEDIQKDDAAITIAPFLHTYHIAPFMADITTIPPTPTTMPQLKSTKKVSPPLAS